MLAKSREEFEQLIEKHAYDLVLTDFNILGYEGLQVLEKVQNVTPDTPVIVVTGTGSEEIAVKALKKGAADYIIKSPQHIVRLPKSINTVLEQKQIKQEQEKAKKELEKLNRIYSLISQVNQLIVRTKDRDKLLQEVCNLAITYGKFHMAWVGFLDQNTNLIKPFCWAGREDGYLSKIDVNQKSSIDDGKGPTMAAFSSGSHFVCNDIQLDPVFAPWRKDALSRNYRSSISLPIRQKNKITGTYNIYATEPHFFDKQEIDLFKEIVSDLSYALDALEADETRKKVEEELKDYFEHDISANFMVTENGDMISCNKTFYKIFRISDKIPHKEINIKQFYKRPQDRDELISKVKKYGKLENYEMKFILQDGSQLYTLGNVLGNFDKKGNLITLREYMVDITKRKLAEESLLKLSRAVEQSPVSIIITDKEGYIEYVNPTFSSVTGYKPQEVIGKNPRLFSTHEKSKKEYQKLWDTILSGRTWRGELHNKKKNGELFWEQTSICPIVDEKGEITHFVSIEEDITEKRAKDLELKKALEKAQESDRLKSAFLANMSHEIRTPMNGILGFAGLLKESETDEKQQKEYIDIIKKSADRMLNIITDIINISKIESGQMELSISETDLNGEMDYLYSFFKPEADLKKIKLNYNKSLSSAEAIIETDFEKVSGILTNLIKNAIKFTGEGNIDFGYEKKGYNLEFYVKDTGCGIPDKNKAIIFERFRQGSESLTRGYEGAGLGLAISKAYVKILGGEIWFESKCGVNEENHGSTFYFTIPYSPVFKRSTEDKKRKKIPDKNHTLGKFKILVVEDDEVSEMLLKDILKPIAYETLNAFTGATAVEICRQNPDIDIILMDIRMPEMDGYKATKLIREFNNDVIIIAQTAFAMEGDREKAFNAGCNDYITKPIELDKLKGVLNKFNFD